MADNTHEKMLQELKKYLTDTKLLVEKVMKMRIQCKESQMIMLRSFDPKYIKILEISNELSSKSNKQIVNKKS